jgi:hypothetical protein
MRLFHVSEDPFITVFKPRPSPSVFEKIKGEVVFAISEQLLHNYLLPRDCPRVSFYAGPATSLGDADRFLGTAASPYVLAVEKAWLPRIMKETVYLYELPETSFELLDECAGYYIAYEEVEPVAVRAVQPIMDELLARDIELRVVSSLWPLADAVTNSSLQFSCIRMRNAAPR